MKAEAPQVAGALQALELGRVFELLGRQLASPLGERGLKDYARSPLAADVEQARRALDELREAMEWLREAEASERRDLTPLPRFSGLRDLGEAAAKLNLEGAVLEPGDLFGLFELLSRADETRQRLWRERARKPLLGDYGDRFGEFQALVRRHSGKIQASGELVDHASSGLSRTRRQIEQQRVAVHRSLEVFVRKHFDEGTLQDDYATIRNGRSVVPVKASLQSRIEGVIHASSGSGQTVFVEPLATITENNKLLRLLEEEQREILRILREMTAELRLERQAVQQAVETLMRLELIFAKARFGREFRCCLPVFSASETLRLEWARHPLLEDVLRREGKKTIPLSVELSGGSRVLVVSGPNAGGKTVVLKTVGLLAVMAQCGLPVPADEAELPWFDAVLADIGDAQSIEASLSTFSAHIEKLKAMMAAATGRSLVIIDELAGATDPAEGGAFGVAVVDHFLERGAFALVSTHLPALKVHAANTEAIVSAAMGFDQTTLSPTHRLLLGAPGESAGLAMAERLGVPREVIERARRALANQEAEAAVFLATLRRQVEENDRKANELKVAEHRLREREQELVRRAEQSESKKLEELEARFEREARRARAENEQALAAAVAKIESARVDSRRAVQEAERLAAKTRRQAGERIEEAAATALGRAAEGSPPAASEVLEGATVKLPGFGAQGKVLRRLGDDRWEVEVGRLKMQIGRDDIAEVVEVEPETGRALPAGVSFTPAPRSTSGSLDEINVIGKTADEAQADVDKFLDKAVVAEIGRLRVIHGHGTNALRRALWKMFASHVHVEKYYQAEQYEGGAGATIVEVRI